MQIVKVFPYNISLFTMLSMFLSSLSNVSYGSITMFIHSDKKIINDVCKILDVHDVTFFIWKGDGLVARSINF